MNDKKERVYSEEDLCEYTILQKIDELEKQLKNIKNEFNDLYETKTEANAIHVKLRQSDAKINNRINTLNEITPTDIGVKDNKLGLLHDTTWLTNQDAINLDGFTYDEATKTLKASGGGGEGSITLYRHHIRVQAGPNNSFASLELYTKSNTIFTNDLFIQYIQGKKIGCTGRVLRKQKWYNISYIYGYSGGISAEWYDLATIEENSAPIQYPQITDDVYQVE